jgi:AraC-like DNA-binding protein
MADRIIPALADVNTGAVATFNTTDPDKLTILQFVPPPALAPYVTQIYFFACEERFIRDFQPAALGHLVFFLRGGGELRFNDGHINPLHGVSLFGPCTAAAEFSLNGPFLDFGLALSPLGFVALTGKAASSYADRLVDAAEIFGSEITVLGKKLCEGYANGSMAHIDLVHEITDFLLPYARNIPASHIGLIQIVAAWISSEFDPDIDLLYSKLNMSRSTATRLITRYFGSPPKPLMRKYRALRAASHLCDPACPAELRTKIEALFYDQPHMIREIRHFTGRTPGSLEGDDSKILRMWLSKDNYRDLEADPG